MIKDKVKNLIKNDVEIKVSENFSDFSLALSTENKITYNCEAIIEILDCIKETDSFSFTIIVNNGEPKSLSKKGKDNIDNFIKIVEQEFRFYEDKEPIELKLNIYKSENNQEIHIYSYSDFIYFFQNLDLVDLLEILNTRIISNGGIQLFTATRSEKPFKTLKFSFNSEIENGKSHILTDLYENSHFGNSNKYPVNPYFFNPINDENKDFVASFESLCTLFSMIYIFDISEINDVEKSLFYKINGFKAIQGRISITHQLKEPKELYFKLFEWCYSSEGNITDKLGIARNIISIYYKDNILKIEKGILASTKSSYKTYLKENISKYIEIRGKIQDELIWISQKSGEIIDKYLSNYQKSIFTFLSFFISVFVLKIITNKNGVTSIFGKDITILSMAFLVLSIAFLIFSSYNLKIEKRRLSKKYKDIKSRYKDLLIEKDIQNILQNDSEFEYEITYIRKRYKLYLWLWIITITILLVAILIVSSYI